MKKPYAPNKFTGSGLRTRNPCWGGRRDREASRRVFLGPWLLDINRVVEADSSLSGEVTSWAWSVRQYPQPESATMVLGKECSRRKAMRAAVAAWRKASGMSERKPRHHHTGRIRFVACTPAVLSYDKSDGTRGFLKLADTSIHCSYGPREDRHTYDEVVLTDGRGERR